MRRVTLLLLAVVFVVESTAAFAQAGRIPVWMPGTVIAVDGSYVVTRNIFSPGPPVISILAANVDLDLNGMTLTGIAGGPPVISIPGPVTEIRIHNGRIASGGMSIDAAGMGRKLVIEKVHSQDASGPGPGAIHAFDIENVIIRQSTVVGAATPWSIAIDGGILGKTGTIEDNVLESAASGGIQILGGQAFALLHNRIDGPGPGISLAGEGCLISENTVRASGADGIALLQGRGNKFFDNVVAGSAGSGINLMPPTANNLVLNNVLTGNGGHGLWVQGIQHLLERNTLNGNGGCGLYLTGPTNAFGRNLARGNGGVACFGCGALFPPDSCAAAPGNSSYGDNLIPGPPVF